MATDPNESGKESSAASDQFEGAALMLFVACLWGANFPAVKLVLESGLPASAAGALRFGLAAVALSPALRGARELPRELLLGGLECGAWIALGYIAQAQALETLPSGVVAFICSLQVVLVPLVQTAFGGKLTPRLGLASFLCVAGVALLELGLPGTAASASTAASTAASAAASAAPPPDLVASLLALLQPIGFGISYVRISSILASHPGSSLQLSALQLASNAAIALAWLVFDLSSGGSAADALASTADWASSLSQPSVALGLLYTGLCSTALTVVLQTRALGKLSAPDASVIVATEPLWAAGFAALLLGEALERAELVGGSLIVLGCLANAVLPPSVLPLGGGAAADEGAADAAAAARSDQPPAADHSGVVVPTVIPTKGKLRVTAEPEKCGAPDHAADEVEELR